MAVGLMGWDGLCDIWAKTKEIGGHGNNLRRCHSWVSASGFCLFTLRRIVYLKPSLSDLSHFLLFLSLQS